MKGMVVTRSENLLARAARKAGLHITAGPWALVEFQSGLRMVVDSRARVERVKEQPRVLRLDITCNSPDLTLQTVSE